MNKRLLPLLGAVILPMLSQCNSLEKDIAAINARNMEIAREPRGSYFVGRRYHVPSTRFWGYLAPAGQTWRTAQLVIMDESACRTPDRLPEYAGNPRYAYDNNYEYRVYGKIHRQIRLRAQLQFETAHLQANPVRTPSTPIPAGSSNPRKNMTPRPSPCARPSCPWQPPSRSGKRSCL